MAREALAVAGAPPRSGASLAGSRSGASSGSRGGASGRTGAYVRGEASLPVSGLGRGWEAPALLLATVALLAFGLVTVFSASMVKAHTQGLPAHYFVIRQAAGGAMGLFALVLCAQVDYRALRRLAWPLLSVVLLLLLLTVVPWTDTLAPRVNGARRWLALGPVALQPGELAKLVAIVWTAALTVKKQDRLGSLRRGLLPFLLVWGALVLLIVAQPNLSTAVLVLLLCGLVVFAGGGRIGHFVLLALLGLPVLWLQIEGVGYRLRRVAAFLDPGADLGGVSYQINQALIAVGSGGVLGRGFGRGQQKFGFLPEPHNDFVFAMIAEEWGLLGVVAVVALFALFTVVGYRVARQAPDLFGALLAVGLTNLIAVQALLHMAVNLALVPTTGITLPFISYGRSSLLVCLAAVGLLIGVARVSHEEGRVEAGGRGRRGGGRR